MNIFASPRDTANQEAFADLIPPTEVKAGFFSGIPTAAVQAVGSTINDFAMPLADAATPMLMPGAKKIDELFKTDVQGFLQREQQKTHDAMVRWTPDRQTVGWLGDVVYSAGNVLGDVALGTALTRNPLAGVGVASGAQGYKAYRMAQMEGLDDTTAAKMAGISGFSTFVGAFLPVAVNKSMATGLAGLGMQAEVAGASRTASALYGTAGAAATIAANPALKIASGGALQALTGIPTRGLTSSVLENAGYTDMAKQYHAFDVGEMISDFAIGSLFAGGVHGYEKLFSNKPPKTQPSDLAAALTLNNASHLETGTAPGIPTDPAARAAHVEAINKTIEDMLAGREVDVGDKVTHANFIENPVAVETRKGVMSAVEDHLGADWQSLKMELESRGLPGDTSLYSRGAGERSTVEHITAAARESFGKDSTALVDNGVIKTVQSVGELPPRADGQPHPADTKAVFDGNTVHIVADNVAPSEVKGVVLHEVGAHYGMEQMLGTEGYRRLLSEIDAKVRAGNADFVAAADLVPADTPANQRLDETLAYLVQNRPDLPLVQRLISQLKTAIYRLTGGRFVDLNADDLRTLAVSALKRVSSAEAARAQESVLYARSSPQERVAEMLQRSAQDENAPAVVVGARPGEFGWTFADNSSAPPPIQHPVQRGPRLEKIGASVKKILTAKPLQSLVKDITGADGIKVTPIEGTWMGKAEPSFVISGDKLDDAAANKLARLMGFAFAQDATVQAKHSPDFKEGIPTLYIGGGKLLSKSQRDAIIKGAREHGLDLSTSKDQKAVKFMHFGEEADLEGFFQSVTDIAQQAGFDAPVFVRTQGELHEAATYLSGQSGGAGEAHGLLGSGEERSALLGRIFDHLVVPYARAVGAEGYRFSPDRFAQRFGLDDSERELLRQKLMPKEGESRSTVPLMTGEETLDIVPTTERGKNEDGTPKLVPNVTDIMWALQNRAAKMGQIEPGDYSKRSAKIIAQAVASEVLYHIKHATKTAIGWYDAALKAAKAEYVKIFPEIATNPDKAMLFDAVLGITSQGNDVHSNSLFATRVFQLIKDGQFTLTEAVDRLKGTFGNQTRAIELNMLKFEHLIDTNGYDRMRELFNKTMTVSEWNATLRKDPTLFGPDGKPLAVEGAASQKVTGWMVFGPKIGSFINNLHGDYSTLTADLWFSRTWNRILGYVFQHTPLLEAKQYQEFKDALQAEHAQSTDAKTQNGKPVMKHGKPVPWENGRDVVGMSKEDFDKLITDPDMMLALAKELEDKYRVGQDFEGAKAKRGYSTKSDLRRRAKNWIESREQTVAAPRTDLERDFQQTTIEQAQKLIKKTAGLDVTIADIQAALWFHEKELFAKMGASDARSAPADYADAAHAAIDAYGQGELYYVRDTKSYIGGDSGQYLGTTIAAEDGGTIPAVKALENADAEIAKAKQDSQGYDAAVTCALRG